MSAALTLTPKIGLYVPREGNPFCKILPLYLTAHPALRPGSKKQIEAVCNLVADWGGADLSVDEIFQREQFEAWVAWLFAAPKKRGAGPGEMRSPRTVAGKRDYLWSLWKFAHRRGLADNPPVDREDLAPIACPREDPVAWSPDEVARIIHQSRMTPDIGHWKPGHWLSLLWAAWYSAERIESLLSSRLSDLQGDILYVRASRTKDKKAGVHRVKPELSALIRSLKTLAGPGVPSEKADLIWPWPYKINALRARYRRDILRPAGLADDRLHLFHCVRRSSLTETVNQAGIAAAQELARHSSPSLTLDNYVSRRLLRTQAAVDVLPDPTRMSPLKQGTLFAG